MNAVEIEKFLMRYESEIEEEEQKTAEESLADLRLGMFEEYEQTGERAGYEKIYFSRRRLLAIRGLAAILKVEKNIPIPVSQIKRLEETIKEICEEECWAVPAHVNRKDNENWRNTADLFACETAQTLSEIADRTQSVLGRDVLELIRKQVEKRIFSPFFESEIPYAWWEISGSNWNAVCSGAIGSACIHLLKHEKKELEKKLSRIIEALEYYVGGFASDGTCMEGFGYYTYGMSYFTNFAEELYEYTDGKINLFRGIDQIASFMGKCFFTDGLTVRFSDACEKDSYRFGLYCVLKMHFPEITCPGIESASGIHSDSCYRFAKLKLDLVYGRQYLMQYREQEMKEKANREIGNINIFPEAQWCISSSRSGVGFACKGGNNGEPHNHNDIGSFHYEAGKEIFLTDLGAGKYTRNYFGEHRYRILCNHSFGHSVPIIHGKGQREGTDYCCSKFQYDSEKRVIDMEFSNAYADSSLKYLRREYCFDQGSGALEISDEIIFDLNKERDHESEEIPDGWGKWPLWESPVVENLVTQLEPEVGEQGIFLYGKQKNCHIVIDGINQEDIIVKKVPFLNHKGKLENVYAILWPVDSQEGVCRSTVHVRLIENGRSKK